MRGALGRRAWGYLWEGTNVVYVVIDSAYSLDDELRITDEVDRQVNRRSALSSDPLET